MKGSNLFLAISSMFVAAIILTLQARGGDVGNVKSSMNNLSLLRDSVRAMIMDHPAAAVQLLQRGLKNTDDSFLLDGIMSNLHKLYYINNFKLPVAMEVGDKISQLSFACRRYIEEDKVSYHYDMQFSCSKDIEVSRAEIICLSANREIKVLDESNAAVFQCPRMGLVRTVLSPFKAGIYKFNIEFADKSKVAEEFIIDPEFCSEKSFVMEQQGRKFKWQQFGSEHYQHGQVRRRDIVVIDQQNRLIDIFSAELTAQNIDEGVVFELPDKTVKMLEANSSYRFGVRYSEQRMFGPMLLAREVESFIFIAVNQLSL